MVLINGRLYKWFGMKIRWFLQRLNNLWILSAVIETSLGRFPNGVGWLEWLMIPRVDSDLRLKNKFLRCPNVKGTSNLSYLVRLVLLWWVFVATVESEIEFCSHSEVNPAPTISADLGCNSWNTADIYPLDLCLRRCNSRAAEIFRSCLTWNPAISNTTNLGEYECLSYWMKVIFLRKRDV